jgi:hypothetical protein
MLRKYGKIALAVASVGLLVGATMLTGCGPSQLELDQAKQIAETQAKLAAVEQAKLDAQVAANKLALQNADLAEEVSQYKLELTQKDKEILDFNTQIAEEEGYFIDEIELGSAVTETLSDKEVKLFDGQVIFDDDEYDVEEYFKLSGVKVDINGVDYGANPYVVLPENSLSYWVNIDDSLDLSDISKDEPLKVSFLGKEVKISEWDGDKVTFSQGSPVYLNEGETYTFHGMEVKVFAVFDGAAVIKVGTEQKKVYEGNSQKINGVDVYVDEVSYQNYAGGVHAVSLDLGEDVLKTIEDGEEYADDSVWEWTVSGHQLGIKLVEAYNDLDEDEEYQPLAVGKSISLPNDFLTLSFKGLDEVDYKKVSFEEDTKDGNTYVEVKGLFEFNMEDYDRLYVNAVGIYDEDLVLLGSEVEVQGTESKLKLVGTDLVVEGYVLPIDFSKVVVDGVDVSGKDVKVLSKFGIVSSVPEDVVDDKKATILVPEEKVFANLKVK